MTYDEARQLRELIKDGYPKGCWITEQGTTGVWFIDAIRDDGEPIKIGLGGVKIGPGTWRVTVPEGSLPEVLIPRA